MNAPRIGSLFSGYGGLDMGVQAAIGGSVAWHVEYDKAPSKILAHHWPDVPNYGDVTTVDWSQVEPVDIITGGSPCQDLSHAGKRQGMTEGTRSNLWVAMREAIAQLRPSLVVWENVRGAYSAAAEGGPHDHELCLCGGSDRRRGVRPSGHAEGDIPSPSVDRDDRASSSPAAGSPRSVRGDSAAAPEGDGSLGSGMDAGTDRRPSCEVADGDPAAPSTEGTAGGSGTGGRGCSDVPSDVPLGADLDPGCAGSLRGVEAADARPEQEGAACSCPDCGGCIDATACQMEPCAGCLGGSRDGQPSLRALGRVLGDLSDLGYDCRWHGLRAADVGAPHGRFRVFVIASDAQRGGLNRWAPLTQRGSIPRVAAAGRGEDARLALLSTPQARDHKGVPGDGFNQANLCRDISLLPTPAAQEPGGTLEQYHARLKAHDGRDSTFAPLSMVVQSSDWGIYADAIARWEALTRPAPAPTQPSKKGTPQLSPQFSEWLMGLPAGHVTDVPGLSRNDMLKALGNGVVPQQAAAALRFMLGAQAVAA